MKKILLTITLMSFLLVFAATPVNATNLILNGDFENNGASVAVTNLSNAEFSALVDDAFGFGTSEEIDLFRNGDIPFFGTAQSGNWFVGLATQPPIPQFDAFSFLLSDTVNVGSSYNLSFFARGNPDDPISPIQIGLSNIATDFGSLIFTGVATSKDSWDQFNIDFDAQSSASFLTVRTDPNILRHTLVDNFSLTATSAPTLNPANGNYYELFNVEVGWLEAKALAESLTHMGLQGHLATITSQEENDFISNTFVSPSQDIWLGGFQPLGSPEPDGNWQWVTGEPWVYTNWFPGEPNDSNQFFGNNEEHLEIRLNLASQWNDQNLNIGRFYLVEWDTPITEPINIDIKPRHCPNIFKIHDDDNSSDDGSSDDSSGGKKRKGDCKVAILGTLDFEVSTIDIDTIRLNGVNGVIAPVKSRFKDVTAPAALPVGLPDCNCEKLPKDSFEDLVLKFNSQEIIAILVVPVQDGDLRELTLTGNLLDGTPIVGKDCVQIEIKGKDDGSSDDDSSGHKKKWKKKGHHGDDDSS